MKHIKTMVLMFFGLLIAAAGNVSALGTNLVLDYNQTYVQSNLRPGDSGVLVIVIKNTGLYRAENVQVWIPGTDTLLINKRFDMGRIELLESKTLSAIVTVSEKATIGLNTLQVRITYDGYTDTGVRDNDKKVNWEIPIRIYGEANFKFQLKKESYTKDVVDTVNLVGLAKTDLRDVSAKLTSNCTSVIGSNKKYLGALSSARSFDLDYSIKPTSVGICALTLEMEAYDRSGNKLSENVSIGIDVGRLDIDLKIIEVENNLTLGSEGTTKLRIKNLGSTDASDISVTLNLSTPLTPVESSEKYVGTIGAKQEKEVKFGIVVDSSAENSYKVPLVITYYDPAGSKHEVEKNIGLQIQGRSDIKVVLEEANVFKPGSTGKVTVSIINKGFVDANFLTVRLLETDSYKVTSKDTAYIGTLDSDDSDTQDFTIKVYDSMSNGKVPLEVQVEYKDANSNKQNVIKETLQLNILSSKEYSQETPSMGLASTVIMVVAAAIGLVVLYLALWFTLKLLGLITGFLDKKIFKRRP